MISRAAKILGGAALLWWGVLRGASALVVGIKSWAFRGININTGQVDLTLNFLIKNPLFVGLTLKGIQGDIYVQGQKVGLINMAYDYYLSGGHTHQIPVIVSLFAGELGQAALLNIQSGDVNTLTIAFDGRLYIGAAKIPIPLQLNYNWGDLMA